MWDNLGRVAAEYPHLRDIRVFEPGGRVETRGFEHMDRAVATGRRMIIFSGHIANWEIGMLAAVQYGISVAQIYRAANNPLVDRMITRFRGDAGALIPKGAVAARRAIANTTPRRAFDDAGRPEDERRGRRTVLRAPGDDRPSARHPGAALRL